MTFGSVAILDRPSISLHYAQINAFFAHPKNILLSMLSDEDPSVINVAVNKIMKLRGILDQVNRNERDLFLRNFRGGYIAQ